ncbi:LytTR family transcriptional regulator DNA-binding domain-containing protein [Paenibacillus thalictri]|uniref:Uncharacterized protein n=1 Tax=Paenibacillus thalictri TaxID=2527873 RepID=A0A4Q9DQA0_9BACL|nr:LytTR family transcriptional regulator DNA-binding domain-containing protein [Paenibacillus thalictri]TBL78588.1 hypothetical protein EYB31_13890 [Paenibacillus thalictri]
MVNPSFQNCKKLWYIVNTQLADCTLEYNIRVANRMVIQSGEKLFQAINEIIQPHMAGLDDETLQQLTDAVAAAINQHEARLRALVLDPNEPGELINIFVDEILYIDTDKKRRIVHHHKNGADYMEAASLNDFNESVSFFEHGFRMLDNSNFVNVDLARSFNKTRGEVYFDENQRKAASVARTHASLLQHELKIRGL